ncbi:MAG TPA: hypothetical protein VN682_10145 [Terriglobales bacterium]|nr:hypothetical protein [Terriglobales bacterium]
MAATPPSEDDLKTEGAAFGASGKRPSILEKHVDEVLSRNLHDRDFTKRFLNEIAKQLKTDVVYDHSKITTQTPHAGTSGTIDILASLFSKKPPHKTVFLLIENKLDSSFTPNQPERYASSAIAMSNDTCTAIPIICAPAGYLNRSKYISPFKAKISYECICGLVNDADRTILELALQKFAMPYEPDPVPEVRNFHEGYIELAKCLAPELVVKPNPNTTGDRPIASRTIYFDTKKTLPKLPFLPTLRFSHQCWDTTAPTPSVKIMFGGWAHYETKLRHNSIRALSGTSFYLRKAGDSLGLVRDTPRLENTIPVSLQIEAATQGIRAAAALRAWMHSHEEALREWAQIVTSAKF